MFSIAGRKSGVFREHAQSSGMRPHYHSYPGDEGAQVAAAPRKKAHSGNTKVSFNRRMSGVVRRNVESSLPHPFVRREFWES